MNSIPKFLTSMVVMLIAVLVCISIIFAGLMVATAKTHHNAVISEIEDSNFDDTVISNCIQTAKDKGFALTVSKEVNVSSVEHYRVELLYDLVLPLFGKVHTGKLVGYAYPGASLSETSGLADHYFEIKNGVLGIKATYRWATGIEEYASENGKDAAGNKNDLLPSEITIPTYFNGEKVTALCDYMFANCSELTKVTFEEGVQIIGDYAFMNCTGLSQITFPESMTENGYSALKGTNITSLKAPFVGGVYDNDDYSFIGYLFGADISDLTAANYNQNNTVVPSTLTTIEITQFVGPFACYDVDSLTDLTLGEAVTYLDRYCFDYCDGLTEVTIPKNVTVTASSGGTEDSWGGFGYCTNLEKVVFEEGSKIVELGRDTFQECEKLKEITLPSTLRTIGSNCFENCDSLTLDTAATGKLPEGVEELGRGAFRFCDGFTTVTIPSTVNKVDPLIFNQCENLTWIYVAEGAEGSEKYFCTGTNGELLTYDKTEIVQYPYAASTSYVVPATVVTIREYAFGDTDKLETVDFSAAFTANILTTLGENCFSHCSSISNDIKLPNSVQTIGDYAFYHAGQWYNFWVGPSVTEIGSYAFYDAGSMYGATYLLMDTAPTVDRRAFFTNTLAYGATPTTKYRVYVKNDTVKAVFVADTNYRTDYTDIIVNESISYDTAISYNSEYGE